MTRLLIGTSWKMNLTPTEATRWFEGALPGLRALHDRDLFVLPPFVSIPAAREALAGTPIRWGAQDVHPDDAGAHTGDVSAPMLADLGCSIIEVGHSERRRDHREGDRLIAAKIGAIRRWDMSPLLCVGEPTRRPLPAAKASVARQLRGALGDRPAGELERVIVAYEPVWAIGVGAEAAPLDHIAEMHAAIRAWLAGRGATVTRILYGGSVDPTNAQGIVRLGGVDGLFVGRSALDPAAFVRIASVAVGERRDS